MCTYFAEFIYPGLWQQVSSGGTNHAEVVKVEFYPEIVSYENLLQV